jgi:DNA-binding LacI/PurR family transcriptional regulator
MIILEWHKAVKAWRRLITPRALAEQLGVSTSTINRVISCGGKFKQCSPEKRVQALAARRNLLAELRARGLV